MNSILVGIYLLLLIYTVKVMRIFQICCCHFHFLQKCWGMAKRLRSCRHHQAPAWITFGLSPCIVTRRWTTQDSLGRFWQRGGVFFASRVPLRFHSVCPNTFPLTLVPDFLCLSQCTCIWSWASNIWPLCSFPIVCLVASPSLQDLSAGMLRWDIWEWCIFTWFVQDWAVAAVVSENDVRVAGSRVCQQKQQNCRGLLHLASMLRFSVHLLLLTVAFSTRIAVEENTTATRASGHFAGFGEKCSEHDKTAQAEGTPRAYCADGFVCSKTTWTCKVALMQPCKKSLSNLMGVSDCAGTGTYGRTTTCGKTNLDGESFCCIKGMLPLLSMDTQRGRRAYWTEHAKKPSYGRPIVEFPECCSGKGERLYDFRSKTKRAWMCLWSEGGKICDRRKGLEFEKRRAAMPAASGQHHGSYEILKTEPHTFLIRLHLRFWNPCAVPAILRLRSHHWKWLWKGQLQGVVFAEDSSSFRVKVSSENTCTVLETHPRTWMDLECLRAINTTYEYLQMYKYTANTNDGYSNSLYKAGFLAILHWFQGIP